MTRGHSSYPPTVLLLSRIVPTGRDEVQGIFVVDQRDALSATTRTVLGHLVFVGPIGATRRALLRLAGRPVRDDVAERFEIVRIRCLTLRGRLNNLTSCLGLLRYLRTCRPDVVHVHWSKGMLGAVRAARLAGIPVVVTEHGGPWPLAPTQSHALRQPRRTLNLADLVLPVSDWLASQLQERGVTTTMRVVPNMVDPTVFFPMPSDTRSADREPFHPATAVMVARLDGHPKGVPDVIRAVHLLAGEGFDLRLQIVGAGGERASHEALAEELGVDHRVEFLGTRTRPELADILRSADLFISASHRFETFGVAVAEAMACGLPVVATDVGAIPELIKDGRNGVLVEQANPLKLADGIRRTCLKDWNPQVLAAEAARLLPAKIAGELADIYRDLVSRSA